MDQNFVSGGLNEIAANSTIWTRVGVTRGLTPKRTCTTIDLNPGASGNFIAVVSYDSIGAPHICASAVSPESLIRPAASRDAGFGKVRNENPLPTTENQLR